MCQIVPAVDNEQQRVRQLAPSFPESVAVTEVVSVGFQEAGQDLGCLVAVVSLRRWEDR